MALCTTHYPGSPARRTACLLASVLLPDDGVAEGSLVYLRSRGARFSGRGPPPLLKFFVLGNSVEKMYKSLHQRGGSAWREDVRSWAAYLQVCALRER